jgi:hypothetical protein
VGVSAEFLKKLEDFILTNKVFPNTPEKICFICLHQKKFFEKNIFENFSMSKNNIIFVEPAIQLR